LIAVELEPLCLACSLESNAAFSAYLEHLVPEKNWRIIIKKSIKKYQIGTADFRSAILLVPFSRKVISEHSEQFRARMRA